MADAETLKSLLGDDLKVKLDDEEIYYLGLFEVQGEEYNPELPGFMSCIWWAVLDDYYKPITNINQTIFNTSSRFAMEMSSNFEFD